jgi:hypothetical protein
MKKTDGAHRLDSLLSFWEDTCFIQKIGAQLSLQKGESTTFKLDGPLTYAPEFRKFILKFNGVFTENAFLKFLNIDHAMTGSAGLIPLSLLAWNHHSRRIFHLPTDIQTILDTTSLGGITWEEIRFPFDSFFITLEDPIISDDGTEFDCILISKIDPYTPQEVNTEPIIEIRILSKNFSEYKNLSNGERKRADAMIHNRQYAEILSFLKNLTPKSTYKATAIYILPDKLQTMTIQDSIPDLGKHCDQLDMVKDSAMDSALHIALNLCLYLENFSSNTLVHESKPSGSSRKTNQKKFDLNAIQQVADIFTVKCAFKMTRHQIDQIVMEEKEIKAGKAKSTHWRRAHWRRKPNCGHIPMKVAPKDWIPRKLINADRLPPNSLPQGTTAITTK